MSRAFSAFDACGMNVCVYLLYAVCISPSVHVDVISSPYRLDKDINNLLNRRPRKYYSIDKSMKQAGAELGQAQVKLEVVDEGLAKA